MALRVEGLARLRIRSLAVPSTANGKCDHRRVPRLGQRPRHAVSHPASRGVAAEECVDSARVGLARISRAGGSTIGRRRPVPALPPGPTRRHGDRTHQRPDQTARPQIDTVTRQQADQQPTDEGTHQPSDDRQRPVDPAVLSPHDQLGNRTDGHAEHDDREDEHAQSITTSAGP